MTKMKKNNLSKILGRPVFNYGLLTIIFSLIAKPLVVGAQAINPVSNILLKCTQSGESCGWIDLINLINAMIKYGIELIAIVFVLILLYAGFLYLTSGGDASKVKKVREMINKVMWGLICTLCGWIIVYFILKSLGVNPKFYNDILS